MNNLIHVEVVQKRHSRASKEQIKESVQLFLSNLASLTPGAVISGAELQEQAELCEHVEQIAVSDDGDEAAAASPSVSSSPRPQLHVFRLHAGGAESDALADEDGAAAAEVWSLPALEFHGLWESLVFDSALKRDTLRFVECALEFAELGVDPLVVGCNRVVLLHGPPGTGKTSLCRALAHKLAVRFGERFPRARLVEINAHGLFSKWFAESGKLVARLFERVHEMAADPRLLACVLVDEVESLAHARRAALAGLEPSDCIRAVNALLTQLDRLRRLPNVLVLTTTNVTGAVDVAFADRADVKRRVGPPSARAAYEILRGCCEELMARGAVAPRERLFALRVLEGARWAPGPAGGASLRLWAVARAAAAAPAPLSARALRRLPLLARALHCPAPPSTPATPALPTFVAALHAALEAHLRDHHEFLEDASAPPPATDTTTCDVST